MSKYSEDWHEEIKCQGFKLTKIKNDILSKQIEKVKENNTLKQKMTNKSWSINQQWIILSQTVPAKDTQSKQQEDSGKKQA